MSTAVPSLLRLRRVADVVLWRQGDGLIEKHHLIAVAHGFAGLGAPSSTRRHAVELRLGERGAEAVRFSVAQVLLIVSFTVECAQNQMEIVIGSKGYVVWRRCWSVGPQG